MKTCLLSATFVFTIKLLNITGQWKCPPKSLVSVVFLTSVVSTDVPPYIGGQLDGASYISGEMHHYISVQGVPLTFVVNGRSPSIVGSLRRMLL